MCLDVKDIGMQVDKEYLCKASGTQAGTGLMNDNHNIENNNSEIDHPGAISDTIQNSSEVPNSGQQSLEGSHSQALKKPIPEG